MEKSVKLVISWHLAGILLSRLLYELVYPHSSSPLNMSASQQLWGYYSPYYAVEEYQLPPNGCEVTQVNILQRHGARYPTSGKSKAIQRSLERLQSASNYTDAKMKFLHSYQWSLGEDDLVPFGAAQSYESGVEMYRRYGHLVDDDTSVSVRSSEVVRVVDSAVNWTSGYFNASGKLYGPTITVMIPETNSHNTLDNKMPLNFKELHDEMNLWRDMFSEPIVKRLNAALVGTEVTNEDIPMIMSLCAFDTVYKKRSSPFCRLFSLEEFEAFAYYQDLYFYYVTGYGNPQGRVHGIGYVNELLARLTGNPFMRPNSILDSSPDTFPLGRAIYADFSHDVRMIAVYSALGLFPQQYPLTAANFNPNRTWATSRLVPFSARMVTEKLKCTKAGVSEDFVRILVNDAVQPLPFCGGNKLCRLEDFVESQVYARSNGDSDLEKCFL